MNTTLVLPAADTERHEQVGLEKCVWASGFDSLYVHTDTCV